MTEACSGRHGDLAAIEWYVVTGAPSISIAGYDNLAGYYEPSTNRIILADTAGLEGVEIRHEMLHALLRVGGHPRDEFLGACAGTVTCLGTCIIEAGPPSPPDPAAVLVEPNTLVATGVVDPAAPTRAIDDGWFSFTILVTNPRSAPVIVALPPSGDAGPLVSFSWQIECARDVFLRDELADDMASVARFAAGETKRWVVDFRIRRDGSVSWGIAQGKCVFKGFYGGRFTGAATVADTATVGP